MQIEFDSIIRKANICLRNNFMPNHNAFTFSEVIGAVTGVPKEIVLTKMMEMRQEMDKAIADRKK